MSWLLAGAVRAGLSVASGYMLIDLMLMEAGLQNEILQAIGTLYVTICVFGLLTLIAEGDIR